MNVLFAVGLLLIGGLTSPPAKDLLLYAARSSVSTPATVLHDQFGEVFAGPVTARFAKSRKPNIVLIYAESLGARYFDEKVFPGLVPRLAELKGQSIDFSKVAQGVGADWTIAGMVASQCGYPLAVAHDVGGNELNMFEDFLPGATCIGDLLHQDGYRLAFIGGADARFAGKGKFLRSHGYDEILDRRVLEEYLEDKSYLNKWGAYDDSLSDYALGKFTELSSAGSPFLLTILTLDTHHPNGFLSQSCGLYGEGENSSLNAVHCADQLIPDFVTKIRRSAFSDNTIIIVLSDHLPMRNQASELLEASTAPRRLTFFVNTPDGRQERVANPGLHYDIAPTILDLAGYQVSGQMGFGSPLTRGAGYLPAKFGESGWISREADLMAIGRELWNDDVNLDESGIRLVAEDLSMWMDGRSFDLSSDSVDKRAPASTLFIFDDQTLRLGKIEAFPFDEGLAPETLPTELLRNKEKLALVITRARNLQGFTDPLNDPGRGAFFFGKPGSDFFAWGLLTGDFFISYDLIQQVAKSRVSERVIRAKENLLKEMESKKARQG